MSKLQIFMLALSAWLSSVPQASARGDETTAVEDTVRKYEHACEVFDFTTANSLLMPDARWIEDSYPEAAKFTGEGWSKHWQEMKDAKVGLRYRIRDFDTHIQGEIAWITLSLDSVATADTPEGINANGGVKEWRGTFVESYVLLKQRGQWKVALGHTTLLPKTSDSSDKR
jgi:ketosteroid isomerase-like protein